MYNILICEDDSFIASSLKNLISGLSSEIKEIYITSNGEEALSILEKTGIDLLITDMQMPIMNGVELVNELRKRQYDCKIIVLSGFSEFDYAQSVIKHDISEYLLKPITRNTLETTVGRVFDELKTRRNRNEYIEGLESKLQEQLPLLIEKYLYEACYGTCNKELSKLLGLNQINNMKLLIMSINEDETLTNNLLQERNKQLSILFTTDAFNKSFSSVFNYKTFTIDSQLCILLFGSIHTSNDDLERKLKEFQQLLLHNHIHISVGISSTFSKLTALHHNYKEANSALSYNQYYGHDSITFFENIQKKPKSIIFMDISDMKKRLYDFIELGKYDAISKSLSELKSKLIEGSCSMEYIRTICLELISIVNLFAYEEDIDLPGIMKNEESPITSVLNAITIDEQFVIIENLISILKSQLHRSSEDLIAQRIQQIKLIIHDNISSDLTLDFIASKIFLTPNYIGTIFKQSTGKSFKEYVKSVKIKEAKQLLMTTHLKVFEVSEAVGYKSVTYFSKKFKESTGYLPSDYRQLHSNEL